MGLDITAYRQLKKAPGAKLDDDGNPLNWERFNIFWINEAFPGRAEGVEAGVPYEAAPDNIMGFRAGSYSGYNDWREWLAALAGYEAPGGDRPCSQGAWVAESGPFLELINFSDCGGTIGPVVAAKLAKDFAEYDERAKEAAGDKSWYYTQFQKWREAFEMASDGGAVEFQ